MKRTARMVKATSVPLSVKQIQSGTKLLHVPLIVLADCDKLVLYDSFLTFHLLSQLKK